MVASPLTGHMPLMYGWSSMDIQGADTCSIMTKLLDIVSHRLKGSITNKRSFVGLGVLDLFQHSEDLC